jgi:hypothetical protein
MTTSPNRLLAAIAGVLYVIIGALGFTVTSGVGFFAPTGALLFGVFELNGFHNVVHLAIGAVLLVAATRRGAVARRCNQILGSALLAVGLVGLFLIGTELNILAINGGDEVLNFATAAVLLLVGFGAETSPDDSGSQSH